MRTPVGASDGTERYALLMATDPAVCEHPRFEREFYLGSDTGDKICTSCREVFTRGEWLEMAPKPKL
jgi:hypothetical protein